LQIAARIPLHTLQRILPTPLHSGHGLTDSGFRAERLYELALSIIHPSLQLELEQSAKPDAKHLLH
jgi:hypothetical protein